MNPDKLTYRVSEVKYAGYILTSNGHKPDPEKIRAIRDMNRPEDLAGVRRLLGMVNFLAQFMPKLSDTAEPLT